MPLVWEVYGQAGLWDHLYPRIAASLDPLTKYRLAQLLPIYSHGYRDILTGLICQQVLQLGFDFDVWRRHMVQSLPGPAKNFGQVDRTQKDLELLHVLKMNNLDFSRAIQWILKAEPQSPTTRMKHFWLRLLTSVGRKEDGAHQQHFGHLFMMLDVHTQNPMGQEDMAWLDYPLWKMAYDSGCIVLCPARQASLSPQGYDVPYVFESSPLDLSYRYPRLRYFEHTPPDDQFMRDYLHFLHFKHTSCAVPKRTSTFLSHARIEPLYDACPPLEMKRHLMDGWYKAWNQIDTPIAPDCTAVHGRGRRHMRANLTHHLELIEQWTGVGLEQVTGRHDAPPTPLLEMFDKREKEVPGPLVITPYCCSYQGPVSSSLYFRDPRGSEAQTDWFYEIKDELEHLLRAGEPSWTKTCLTHVPERPDQAYHRCFHRVAHTCARCCFEAPLQELFFALTQDSHQEPHTPPPSPTTPTNIHVGHGVVWSILRCWC